MLPRIKVLWDLAELYLGVVCLRFGLHVARLWQRPEQALHIRNRHAAEALILASLPRWCSIVHLMDWRGEIGGCTCEDLT